MDEVEQTFWKFLCGDIGAQEFESWVYTSRRLEGYFGPDMYLQLLSAGYREEHDIAELKHLLRTWIEVHVERRCDCIAWKKHQVIPIGFDTPVDFIFLKFDVLKERNPWLDLARCKMCRRAWYIATDTVDDDYHLLRLTEDEVREVLVGDRWPTLFDNFRNVWPDPNYPSQV